MIPAFEHKATVKTGHVASMMIENAPEE